MTSFFLILFVAFLLFRLGKLTTLFQMQQQLARFKAKLPISPVRCININVKRMQLDSSLQSKMYLLVDYLDYS